ncbi:hypothetical protein AB1N83_006337 [Pleurotus pulmonarius]
MPSSSATQRTMLIAEILGNIFEQSETVDQVRIAHVCKSWCDIATRIIWRQVQGAEVLFRLLAPLTVWGGKTVFSRALTARDWDRFDYYACRVHVLVLISHHSVALHPSLIAEISAMRGPSNLLPNLRCLKLDPSTAYCAHIFLNLTIASVYILRPQTNCNLVGPLISSLPTKTPRLKRLCFEADAFSEPPLGTRMEEVLAVALRGLSSLIFLELPTWWLTFPILHAAATCPKLSELGSKQLPHCRSTSNHIDASRFEHLFSSAPPPSGGFPSLRSLETCVPFLRTRSVFSQQDYFSVLSYLNIMSPCFETPHQYGALLAALPNCCPNLTVLVLRTIRSTTSQHDSVTFTELSPILRMKTVEVLDIHHSMPFQLVTEDVVAICQALPYLAALSLNPNPGFEGATTLNVSVLWALRGLCPDLETLELYLDTLEDQIPQSGDEYGRAISGSAGFENLLDLRVSSPSPLSSPIPLAIYLSRVVPPFCSFEFLSTHDDDDARNWEEVERLIPAFRQVREEGIRVGPFHRARTPPRPSGTVLDILSWPWEC